MFQLQCTARSVRSSQRRCWVMLVGCLLVLASTARAMNKADLIDAISNNSGLSKADSKRALDSFVDNTSKALKKGDRVALVGFGSFSVSQRAARKGRNPQTGASINIPARKVVTGGRPTRLYSTSPRRRASQRFCRSGNPEAQS